MQQEPELDLQRTIEHVGEGGWRVRVYLETMEAMIEVGCASEKLRGTKCTRPEQVLKEHPECGVSLLGLTWMPELLIKLLVLQTADLKRVGSFFSDLAAARTAAVRAIMKEHRELMDYIRPLQRKTIAILEEDLSYREPQGEVN